MKRSVNVSAPLLAATALTLLTGCREQMKRCVDEQNRVVPDNLCQNLPNSGQNSGPYGPSYPYRFYYGGSGNYSVGSTATGGGYIPSAGTSYSTSTTRGGFGGSSGASGGGDSSSGSGS